jgi:hypothetical protein
MRQAGYVAYIRRKRNAYEILNGKSEEKNHLGDQGRDGRITLISMLKK